MTGITPIENSPIFEVDQTSDSISFHFSSTMKNIDEVCERSSSYLVSKIKGVEKQLFTINLVMREGLTNAIRHGNAGDHEKKVKFLLKIAKNRNLKLMIEDEGDGFDWRKQNKKNLHDDADHGRGIIIIDTYFTSYSYNEKGNILFLEKNLTA